MPANDALEEVVVERAEEALQKLNQMREEEGRGIEHELRERMEVVRQAEKGVEKHRHAVLQTYTDKLRSRMQELVGAQVDSERILQEAALLVNRSDIQEELVRLDTHVNHFLGLLSENGEIGKKLDFLLQEMNREANTLLSKTSGLAGEALNITQMGLAIKSELKRRANRCRTSNDCVHHFGPVGFGEIHAGERSSVGSAGSGVFDLLHHAPAQGQRAKCTRILLRFAGAV